MSTNGMFPIPRAECNVADIMGVMHAKGQKSLLPCMGNASISITVRDHVEATGV